MSHGRHLITALVLAGTTVLISGCALSFSASPATTCLPRFDIEPEEVRPGDAIVLTSDSACDVDQPGGGWTVLVAPSGMPDLGVRVATTDGFAGSFRVEIVLPDDFPSGSAFAAIENWDYSACSDTGSCASAGVDFVVLPAQ